MKRIILILLIGLLWGCSASVVEVDEPIFVTPEVVIEEPVLEEPVQEVIMRYVIRYHHGYDDIVEERMVRAGAGLNLTWRSRDGYRFDGWYLDETLTVPISRLQSVSEDVDLYAKWIEIPKEPFQIVFDDIRQWFDFDFEAVHPIDYYVSPSSDPKKADIIYNGMYQAAGLFATYLEGFDPMSVTVLHPNDFEWYEDITATLDLFDYGDPWFQRTSADGGGAVFESYSGRPHMFFLIPDRNQPNPSDIDWYVHETMHIFQLGILQGRRDENLGCMYTEGGATLIGNVLSMVNERMAYNLFMQRRDSRINTLKMFYAKEPNKAQAIYDQLAFGQNDRCNVQAPGFGYNLGALVAEKMILDFGTEAFMDMHFYFDRYRIDQVFGMKFEVDYFTWLEEEAVPYVMELIF